MTGKARLDSPLGVIVRAMARAPVNKVPPVPYMILLPCWVLMVLDGT